jgi:hypothetical protein
MSVEIKYDLEYDLEGGNATLVRHGFGGTISFCSRYVRKWSLRIKPYAQCSAAISLSYVEPRKRRGRYCNITPDYSWEAFLLVLDGHVDITGVGGSGVNLYGLGSRGGDIEKLDEYTHRAADRLAAQHRVLFDWRDYPELKVARDKEIEKHLNYEARQQLALNMEHNT